MYYNINAGGCDIKTSIFLKEKVRGTIGNPSGDLCWAVINVIVKEDTGEIVGSNRGICKETYRSYGRAPESRIHMIGGNRIGRERAHKITHQWEQTRILNSQSFQYHWSWKSGFLFEYTSAHSSRSNCFHLILSNQSYSDFHLLPDNFVKLSECYNLWIINGWCAVMNRKQQKYQQIKMWFNLRLHVMGLPTKTDLVIYFLQKYVAAMW